MNKKSSGTGFKKASSFLTNIAQKGFEKKDSLVGKDKLIEFDIIAPKIILDKKLFLSGNYRGTIKNNEISSVAIGKMSFGKNPILDQGELKIKVNKNNSSLIKIENE